MRADTWVPPLLLGEAFKLKSFFGFVCRSVSFLLTALGPDVHPGFLDVGNEYSALSMQIIYKGVRPSMGSRDFFLRTTRDRLGIPGESTGSQCDVVRSRLITEVRVSSHLGNRAETRGFYGADFFRSSDTSTESVVFSRATHVRENHCEWHDAVKSDLFSRLLRRFRPENDKLVKKWAGSSE